MEVVEFGRLTDAQRAELGGDERDPFDAEGATLRYRRKDHHVEAISRPRRPAGPWTSATTIGPTTARRSLRLVGDQDTEMISPVRERPHQPILKSNKTALTDRLGGVASVLASPQPSAGNAFPAPTLGRRV